MVPDWLHELAWLSLAASALSATIVAADIAAGHRQKMAVMNLVWPITAIWAGPLGLLAYFLFGRQPARKPPAGQGEKKPFWQAVVVGVSHCGAGCSVGDLVGEWLVFLTGFTLAGSVLWANYTVDFALAYVVGIAFQYYSIAPMRNLSGWPGIVAALRADTVSLVAYEVGMFAFMGFSNTVLFPEGLKPTRPVYWVMMQIAMFAGFLTAFPANWWLIRKGYKERM